MRIPLSSNEFSYTGMSVCGKSINDNNISDILRVVIKDYESELDAVTLIQIA